MLAQASIDKHHCQSVCWKSPRNNKSSPFLNQHLSSSWMPLTGKHDGLVPKARHQTASPINNSLPLTPACIQVYSPYIICFPGRMKQSISQPCMFYKSNKILALSTECGIFKSSIHGAAGVPRPGNSWKARRDQLAERSGISYSDHAKCQQDNLIICDPGVGRKIREAMCRICKRANAKCQTNIGRDEVSRQSQINVGIQRASVLREVDCNTWVIKTARSDRLFILLMRNKWLVFLSRMIFFTFKIPRYSEAQHPTEVTTKRFSEFRL